MNKNLIIVYSYHHHNTEKVALRMAETLEAKVKHPGEISPEEIRSFEMVGFGAGIDSAKHYKPLLELAETLLPVENQKAFIFSTGAIVGEKKMARDHTALRKILLAKGYRILDEFACRGYNTNSFIKYLGGMNNGHPNAEDLQAAELFAQNLSKL